ncbi:MAG: polysaccharide biosynthesis/export family protein [Ferruginibacter sp.]|nr:polysaccharide biosynthesis/export family protein [Ferruginibacter sp.]
MKKCYLGLLVMALMVVFSACMSPSKLYYFHDLQVGKAALDSAEQNNLIRIKKGDRIQITVSSPDPAITAYLNPFGTVTSGSLEVQANNGYLVNQNGEIDFPMVGKVLVDSLTTREAGEMLQDKLSYWYRDLFVNVNLSGRVFFMSGRNGTPIQIRNERLTIFEALSQSGVQDYYDKKDKVWIVRETNGEREFAQINLNKKDIFQSPYYYLRNNDLIYLQPNRISTFLAPNGIGRVALAVTGILVTLFIALRR